MTYRITSWTRHRLPLYPDEATVAVCFIIILEHRGGIGRVDHEDISRQDLLLGHHVATLLGATFNLSNIFINSVVCGNCILPQLLSINADIFCLVHSLTLAVPSTAMAQLAKAPVGRQRLQPYVLLVYQPNNFSQPEGNLVDRF